MLRFSGRFCINNLKEFLSDPFGEKLNANLAVYSIIAAHDDDGKWDENPGCGGFISLLSVL